MMTDLNTRERRKYAESAREIAKAASEFAEAIEAEDDANALTSYLIMSLLGAGMMNELKDVFLQAAEVAKARAELEKNEGQA